MDFSTGLFNVMESKESDELIVLHKIKVYILPYLFFLSQNLQLIKTHNMIQEKRDIEIYFDFDIS